MSQKDNTTLRRKVVLRQELLKQIDDPCVLETHGGRGRVWYRCYSHFRRGAVIERDSDKALYLARQRPTWAIYEMDTVTALKLNVAAHWPVNMLDVDPYGEPWPVLRAFFESERPWPDTLAIAVNDGLRCKLKYGGGWQTLSIAEQCREFGNASMFDNYLLICQRLVETLATQRITTLGGWAGYHCGHNGDMTHYGALLTRRASVA